MRFVFFILLAQNINADYKSIAAKNTVTKKMRLGDRFYIQSVLGEIFGPDSLPITEKFIFMQVNSFGGPCDVYEQVRIGETADALTDAHSFCPGGSGSANLPMTGVSNMMRQGYVLQTCKLLTAESKTLDFALSRVFTIEKIQLPNRENLITFFKLFNPESTPSDAVLTALSKIGANGVDIKKRWALILNTLCTDPTWQII